MTQVGHLLVGATIGVLCKPQRIRSKSLMVYFGVFLLLANVPDLPFPSWGHDRYDISHSLFVNLFLIIVMTAVLMLWKDARSKVGEWGVIFGGIAAWLSHLLLDSFYNHGLGVAIYWPFSDARLVLPMPWFSVVTESDYFTAVGFREYLVEAAFFGLFLAVALLVRVVKSDGKQAAAEK